MNQQTPLVIKIGGSVITFKDHKHEKTPTVPYRKRCQSIGFSPPKNPQPLIIVQGAGSFEHRLAKEYHS